VNTTVKELQNFVRKYSLTVELLVFKYRQQIIRVGVTLIGAVTGPEVTFADRRTLLPIGRVKTNQLLTRVTLDFIATTPWSANSPKLSPVDYWISLQEAAGACVPQPDSRRRPAGRV